jgi:general secretion pathway protein J
VTSGTHRRRLRLYSQAGFTLVEMLVAIALLSLLSVALTAGLRLGIDAWARGSTHSDQLSHTLAVQGLLRDIIGQAYPYVLTADPTRRYVDFDGTNESIAMLAPAPVALAVTGRARFTLAIVRHGGRSDLILTSQPELAPADPPSTAPQKTLLAGASAVGFAYFGQLRSETRAEWHERWTEQPALPQLLRVQVRFPDGDSRLWPDLVIAPRIAADVGCVYDPLTRQCRGR